MILIADSGSTKTDWRLLDFSSGDVIQNIVSRGINPYYENEDEISSKLRDEVLPFVGGASVDQVWFYGAGCTDAKIEGMTRAIQSIFNEGKVYVASDLVGAARALLGESAGIACILGTGSNSCFYDGERIVDNVSPLGFILGDEGSGAVLGKLFLGDLLKRQLPEDLERAFWNENDITQADIIENVYKKPFPNRYLAKFTRFLGEHRDYEYVRSLLIGSFKAFFKRNIMHYDYLNYETGFVGSIATVFESELREAADDCGVRVSNVMKAPIDGLTRFHLRR